MRVLEDVVEALVQDQMEITLQRWLHKGTGIDEYRYFVIPTNLTEAKYLTALEVRPGNKKVVHHTLVWADSTDASKQADAATPEYGYEGSGGSAAGSRR